MRRVCYNIFFVSYCWFFLWLYYDFMLRLRSILSSFYRFNSPFNHLSPPRLRKTTKWHFGDCSFLCVIEPVLEFRRPRHDYLYFYQLNSRCVHVVLKTRNSNFSCINCGLTGSVYQLPVYLESRKRKVLRVSWIFTSRGTGFWPRGLLVKDYGDDPCVTLGCVRKILFTTRFTTEEK